MYATFNVIYFFIKVTKYQTIDILLMQSHQLNLQHRFVSLIYKLT